MLKLNRSPSSTSFPRGVLLRTRALPQAKDCRVRRSSPSSVTAQDNSQDNNFHIQFYKRLSQTYSSGCAYVFYAELLSFIEHKQHQCLKQRHLHLLLPLKLKVCFTMMQTITQTSGRFYRDITSLNSALSTAWPSVGCHCSFLPLCFPR